MSRAAGSIAPYRVRPTTRIVGCVWVGIAQSGTPAQSSPKTVGKSFLRQM